MRYLAIILFLISCKKEECESPIIPYQISVETTYQRTLFQIYDANYEGYELNISEGTYDYKLDNLPEKFDIRIRANYRGTIHFKIWRNGILRVNRFMEQEDLDYKEFVSLE